MADIRNDEYLSSLTGSQMDAALLDMAEHNSEAWAVGERNGFAVGEFDETYENNAKYYAEQAAKVVPTSGVPAIRYDVDQSRILSDTEHETSAYNVFGKPIGVMQTFLNKISEHSYLAKIKKLTGKSAVINQLVQNGDFTSTTGWNALNATISVSGGVLSVTTTTANNAKSAQPIPIILGHKYFLSGDIYAPNTTSSWNINSINFRVASNAVALSLTSSVANAWQHLEGIFTSDRTQSSYGIDLTGSNVSGDVTKYRNVNIIDLTLIFGAGNEPTTVDSLKSAWLAKFGYPLPNYIPYNSGSIVDTDIKGFGSTGLNIWDEEWELGGIIYASGLPTVVTDRIRSKNFCRILPNTTYSSVGHDYTFFYDINFNYIKYIDTPTFTTPSNAHYLKIVDNKHTSYQNNIAIGIGLTEYVPSNPYFRNFPIVLRSAGNVADTVEDTGNGYKVTRRIGQIVIDENAPILGSNYSTFGVQYRVTRFGADGKADGAIFSNDLPQATSGESNKINLYYENNYARFLLKTADMGVTITNDTQWKAWLVSHPQTVNYELATPIVEYHSYNLTYPVTENGTEYFDSPISVPCEIEYGIDALTDIAKGVVTSPTDLTMADLASKRFSNPNLLDNWWFGKGVINQRGFTSGTTQSSAYFIDRWKCGYSTYTLTDDGVKVHINKGSYGIAQVFETDLGASLVGKTVTISVLMADGTIHHNTSIFGLNQYTVLRDTMRTYTSPNTLWITGNSEDEFTIKAVKLELGSVSTLANDSAPDYATELLKCQRYFQRIGSNGSTYGNFGSGYIGSTSSAYLSLPLLTKLRSIPSVTNISSVTDFNLIGANTVQLTAISVQAATCSDIAIRIAASGTFPSTRIGEACMLQGTTASAYIDLSADL